MLNFMATRPKASHLQSTPRPILREKQQVLTSQRTVMKEDNFAALQEEAEKIRHWHVQTDIKLQQKDKELSRSKQIEETLRKSLLDVRMENEKVSMRLQEEVNSRTVCYKKLESTRQMCMLLKDQTTKLEKTLDMCTTAAQRLREDKEMTQLKVQKLTDDFNSLTFSMKEMTGGWEKKNKDLQEKSDTRIDKIGKELAAAQNALQQAGEEIAQKEATQIQLETQLSDAEVRYQSLVEIKNNLEEKVAALQNVVDEKGHELDDLRQHTAEVEGVVRDQQYNIEMMDKQHKEEKLVWDKAAENYDTQIADMESTLAEKNQQYEAVTAEKDEIVQLASEAKSELTKENTRLTEEKDILARDLSNTATELKEVTAKLSEKADSTQALLDSKTDEAEKVSEENCELRSEVTALKKKMEDYEENEKQLGNANDAILKLEESVKMHKEEIEQQGAAIGSLGKEKSDMQEKYDSDMEKKVEEMEAMRKQHSLQIEEMDHKHAQEVEKLREEMDRKKEHMGAEIEGVQKKLTEMQEETDGAKQELLDAKAEHERDMQDLCIHLRDSEELLIAQGEKVKKRNEEIVEFKARIKHLEYEMKHKLRQKDQEITALKSQMGQIFAIGEKGDRKTISPVFTRHVRQRGKANSSSQKTTAKETVAPPVVKRQRGTGLFDDTLDELASEVSFACDTTDLDVEKLRNRRVMKSSTPKKTKDVKVFSRVAPKAAADGPKKAKRARKTTNKNKETAWFETDSVYGFYD